MTIQDDVARIIQDKFRFITFTNGDGEVGWRLKEGNIEEIAEAILAALPAQEWQNISTAVAAERERCAKIAETEGTEYQRQIDIHNKEMLRLYPSPDPLPDYFRECGVYLHAKRSASQNIGGLIRLPPAAYEAQLAAGIATLIADDRGT